MKKTLTLILLLIGANAIAQELQTFTYTVDEKSFTGYYALPAQVKKDTKTILIVHEWWGLNEYPKTRAKQLANEGFIAVCIDMYGTSIVADNPKEAGVLAGACYASPEVAYKRFMAGMNAAKKIKGVNAEMMAAIGYCFGGNIVLNAAKKGAPLDAVVSFHGNLSGPALEKGKLKAAILVCNGADDKFVPSTDIENFNKEMSTNHADYTFINYDNSTHAFTNPMSTAVGEKFSMPIAYNEAADKKSFADFLSFIAKKVN